MLTTAVRAVGAIWGQPRMTVVWGLESNEDNCSQLLFLEVKVLNLLGREDRIAL